MPSSARTRLILVSALGILAIVAAAPMVGFGAGPSPYSAVAGLSPAEPRAINGTIGVDEIDWYLLNVTQPGLIQLLVSWPSPSDDIDVYLLDSRRTVVASSTRTGTNFEIISQVAEEPALYYVAIVPYELATEGLVPYTVESRDHAIADFLTNYVVRIYVRGLVEKFPVRVYYTLFGQPRNTTTSTSFISYVDEDTPLRIDRTVNLSDVERYHTTDRVSWAVRGPIASNITYFHQWKAGLTFSGLSPSHPATITYQQNAAVKRDAVHDMWSGWVDDGSTVRASRAVRVSDAERYYTPDAVAWRATLAFDQTVTYFRQWRPNVVLAGTSAPQTAEVQFTASGIQRSVAGLYGNWSDWVDDGSVLAISSETSGSSASERWYSPLTRWAIRSDATIRANYVHQFRAELSLRGLTAAYPAKVAYTQAGIKLSTFADARWSDWVDEGSALTVQNPVDGGLGERWHTDDTTQWAVAEPLSAAVTYGHQLQITFLFTDRAGTRLLPTSPVRVQLLDPAGRPLNISDYAAVWLDVGTWVLQEIMWEGSNVANLEHGTLRIATPGVLLVRTVAEVGPPLTWLFGAVAVAALAVLGALLWRLRQMRAGAGANK